MATVTIGLPDVIVYEQNKTGRSIVHAWRVVCECGWTLTRNDNDPEELIVWDAWDHIDGHETMVRITHPVRSRRQISSHGQPHYAVRKHSAWPLREGLTTHIR